MNQPQKDDLHWIIIKTYPYVWSRYSSLQNSRASDFICTYVTENEQIITCQMKDME